MPDTDLNRAIASHLARGFALVVRGPGGALLIRRRRVNLPLAALLLLCGIVPGVAYLFVCQVGEERVFLRADAAGEVRVVAA